MFFDRLPGAKDAAGYVCAHRGARSLAPENTLLAARRAVESGADFWEMDVHKTSDGKLVVFHDDVPLRTTDIAEHPGLKDRKDRPIQEFTFEELRSLDAGSWFMGKDPHGTIAEGEIDPAQLDMMRGLTIPTLREALEFTKQNNLPINIEIKDQIPAPGDMSIAEDVLAMLHATGTRDMVLISSFNHDYIAHLHRLDAELPTAALVEDRLPEDIPNYLRKLGAGGFHPDEVLIDAELVRDLTDRGFRVTPYTVNDMDRVVELLEAGCFAVTTDFPQRLRRRVEDMSSRC